MKKWILNLRIQDHLGNNRMMLTDERDTKAYLKYLLFDENFKLVQGIAERIDNGPDAVHTYHTTAGGAKKRFCVCVLQQRNSGECFL